jgi:hypothetical protein
MPKGATLTRPPAWRRHLDLQIARMVIRLSPGHLVSHVSRVAGHDRDLLPDGIRHRLLDCFHDDGERLVPQPARR